MLKIGLAFPSSITYTRDVQLAVEDFFRPFPEYQLIPLYSPAFPHLLPLSTGRFDAIITRNSNKNTLLRLRSACRAVVNCTNAIPLKGIHSVVSDNLAVGLLAGGHLLELPVESFAYLGSCSHESSPVRLAGFRKACPGLKVRIFNAHSTSVTAGGPNRLKAWLRDLPKPAAVFAFNDYLAAHAANAALDLGLNLPDDIRICGVDNDRFAQAWTTVPLTSVDLDETRIGFRAGEIVRSILMGNGGETHTELIPPCGLVVRSSTRREATTSAELNRALAVFKERALLDCSVDEMAARAGLCRRKMERLFKDYLHTTPYAEIINIRLGKAKELLRTTHLTIQEIAESTGFTDARRLCIVLKSREGLTPTEFRGGEAGRRGRALRSSEAVGIRRLAPRC